MQDKIAAARRRDWNGVERLPDRVASYPSMLSQEERRMLHWLAREYFSDAGCICDLGSFLGGSTVSLADGLRAAGRTGRKIHSYDRHRIRRKAWEAWGLRGTRPFPPDGDFLPVTRDLLGELSELVEFHSGDFPEQAPPDGEIEVLFVDIAKTNATNDHVVARFFPKLIPGRSIVVQQDYFHFWPILDKYVMEILHDHFEPLSAEQTSAVFLNTRQIGPDAVERALSGNVAMASLPSTLRSAGARWGLQAKQAKLDRLADSLEGLDELPDSKRAYLDLTGRRKPREEADDARSRRRRRHIGRG